LTYFATKKIKTIAMNIVYHPIGRLVTPFERPEEMPIQPCSTTVKKGHAVIFEDFVNGLKDLTMFSHVVLIYHLHKQSGVSLLVKPFLDIEEHGIFATRAPARPNPIGMSVVKLLGIEGNILFFENLDMLNDTPLLDIKPYVPEFDRPDNPSTGWLSKAENPSAMKSDERFI